ncbi:MAG: glycosyltransferase [Desulfobacterales bacterium]
MAILWCVLIAALLARAVLQFRAYEAIPAVSGVKSAVAPELSVVVPARNESANIAACLAGLLNQEYPSDRLSIVVVDDNSSDDTAAIVQTIAGSQSCLQLLQAGPLPDGWTGKSFACWQGFQATGSLWLAFIDADTSASPMLLSAAVSFAEAKNIDMLSLHPFQELKTFWERVIIPAGLFAVAFTCDLKAVNDPSKPDAAANGQCILIRRQVYELIGGHAAVRRQIAEDTALARLVKQAGYRIYMAGAAELIKVRMYTGLQTLWEGLSKNAVDVVKNIRTAILLSFGVPILGWTSVLLPLYVLLMETAELTRADLLAVTSLGFAALGSAALFATHMAESRYFKIPLRYGLLFPLGLTMIGAITINSILSRWRRNIVWKSRLYPESCIRIDKRV